MQDVDSIVTVQFRKQPNKGGLPLIGQILITYW